MMIDTELATFILAVIGGLVALFQWRRDQAWKQADKLDSFYKEFTADRLIQIACRVLDWNRGNFKFPDGEELRFTHDDVKKSLVLHGDDDLTFTLTQARMRDAYDAMLCFFERLETAIATGLVNESSAVLLFGYWVKHFALMPEHPECSELADRYIHRYASLSTFDSLRSRVF